MVWPFVGLRHQTGEAKDFALSKTKETSEKTPSRDRFLTGSHVADGVISWEHGQIRANHLLVRMSRLCHEMGRDAGRRKTTRRRQS